MGSDVTRQLGQLWPLSSNYEYADLLGHALSGPRRQSLPSWQAEGLLRLRYAERTRPRAELEDELADVISSGPSCLRLELDAAVQALARDWDERGTEQLALPPPFAGPVTLYAPPECVSYEEGYAAPLDWTIAALSAAAIEWRDAPAATTAELATAHDIHYLNGLFALGRDGGELTPETIVTPASEAAVRAGAGALIAASQLTGPTTLVVARPGSHHASRTRAGGTCLVNGLAVAAYAALRDGAAKVAILDLDAHHGNGTEEIFWREPSVLTVSVHQAGPFFPGTGDADARGAGEGHGANLNLPVTAGESWLAAATRAIEWLAAAKVELVLIELSADAHEADPASDLRASDGDFAAVGRLLKTLQTPVVCELGSSLSKRAWMGTLRSFLGGLEG